jgi:hypothetical protein
LNIGIYYAQREFTLSSGAATNLRQRATYNYRISVNANNTSPTKHERDREINREYMRNDHSTEALCAWPYQLPTREAIVQKATNSTS